MAHSLDTIDFEAYDPSRIIDQLENFSSICKTALSDFQSIRLPEDYLLVKRVVLAGMGGSGIANEMIKGLLHGAPIRIDSIHDYSLPPYVDEETLVIVSSFSGNTEESLAAFSAAYDARAKVIAVTTGGQLERMATESGTMLVKFVYDSMPRMALPYLFGSLLIIFNRLGYLADVSDFNTILDQVYFLSEKYRYGIALSDNPAKQLAMKLIKKMPVVYANTLTAPIGLRFKDQLNENAKTVAAYDVFPELNHNAIEGYVFPKLPFHFLFVESNFEPERISVRQGITADILTNSGHEVDRIKIVGCSNLLVEYLTLTLFIDYVSYYLAMANKIDPTSIPNINYLKSRL